MAVTQAALTIDKCTYGSGWDCAESSLYLGADIAGAGAVGRGVVKIVQGSRDVPIEGTLAALRKICGGR
ncbi:hypothetical protein [Streptomyces sp. NBC_01262]|uniref:hypothetical protein n=1 Tax=Streptomyces sp. NBC_01262 TaxID=2903803 RepID=UPI002E37108E|nr:hypothetical protein [Streptomyces sp. NBC_01262]